ncbi:hypothetical protein BO99DRAFT_144731 [Aspergillus violaceofuscus CBS 115571]|uniref:Uncharacterized protein n=1 Tax=Aspergillus violaceofuscus (strain CBS 115571) TaxID=1450538 RepID=A0A2V5HSH8_ASPV1|nr:hypothetical protein BO99DRAFT_144731 [Aspergillus violaceofuscus CBS 115571]
MERNPMQTYCLQFLSISNYRSPGLYSPPKLEKSRNLFHVVGQQCYRHNNHARIRRITIKSDQQDMRTTPTIKAKAKKKKKKKQNRGKSSNHASPTHNHQTMTEKERKTVKQPLSRTIISIDDSETTLASCHSSSGSS